ncbi:hypothetical protein JAAARDRAFT_67597 [Jaapia argillacea MUCL 33604]|uniref:Uncharacterized protein n=1 Tax=Jaapia argillacea MUCL 33604 TaxID=933084 RepID=A0A067Q502_9AGAM|nr:hypothetical protein JAAARDRAFT_67597 [Jaapia argillacea MUCL 33604]
MERPTPHIPVSASQPRHDYFAPSPSNQSETHNPPTPGPLRAEHPASHEPLNYMMRDAVYNQPRRMPPLDYISHTPRLPVYACEAVTAPPNMEKNSRPDPPIANIRKPPHPPSMPYSHMGLYQSEDILGPDYPEYDPPPSHTGNEGEETRPELMIHAPSAPPPYPKPVGVHSWIASLNTNHGVDLGPSSAPPPCEPDQSSYPSSLGSPARPFNWIEDVTDDQPIEAVGFKRCSWCALSYRITDGKRCRCTPSDGDGERPSYFVKQ